MKRSSYFISARSVSADLHASELILAIHDLFPRVESYGILGEWSSRTRASKIAELERCLSLGLHDKLSRSEEGLAARQWLFEHLDPLELDVALLVGYSYLHHELAAYFKARGIPVILYEMTPLNALTGIDFTKVADRVDLALGINPSGSDFIQKAGIPFQYVGSPYKDRADRVKLDPQSFGLQPQETVIAFFPGRRPEEWKSTLPLFRELAQALEKEQTQTVLSVPDELSEDLKADLKNWPAAPHFISGMNLELLSVSTLAVSGCGAITVECGLFEVPCIPIYEGEEDKSLHALLNQMTGRAVLREFSTAGGVGPIAQQVKKLLFPGPERTHMIAELHALNAELQGFAAERVVTHIAQQIGSWKNASPRRMSSKTNEEG